VIESFADEGTRDIFDHANTKEARKTLGENLWSVARRKLTMLNAASDLLHLNTPGNRLEQLHASDRYSIRINAQFRVTFGWEPPRALAVRIEDYH
jgi:proteic killer suppression protein